MVDKVVRGQKIIFRSTPRDENESSVQPATVKLYLNYVHANTGTASTDSPIDMDQSTDGVYEAEFDTKVADAGDAYASVRSTSPAGAEDIKFKIIANPANPDP